jgi:iron complex outermembrane receptor protein
MKNMNLSFGLMPCLALALGCAVPAMAENLLLDEITVRGQQESTTEESLTIREVRESPAKDVGEALRQVEGIATVRKGAIANDVVLRGFQRDNINVLIDGVRLQCACPSRMDPPAFHYDFAEVDHIRIVKGPYDVTNPGSLGGLVDVRSRQAQQGFNSDLSLTYGSYNSVNGSVTASYGTDLYDGLLGYAYKRSDVPESGNGTLITDIYPSTSPNRYRANAVDSKAYEINTGWAKFGLNPTSNSRTELSYSYQDAEHVLYPYLKMDGNYDRTNRLNWTYELKDLSSMVNELKLQVYWDKVSHLMDDSLRVSSTPTATVTRDYSMRTDAETEVVGVKVTGDLDAGPGTLKTGIDYYNRKWDALNMRAAYTKIQPYAPLNMIPDVDTDNVGLFGEYDLPINDQVRLKAGLRGDVSRIEAHKANTPTSVDDDADFSDISGNLRLIYTPVSGLELLVGLGRGVRIPDAEELYIDVPAMPPMVTWRGNPALDRTINHQADLGIKYSADRYYVNASVFYSDLQDYINFYAASSSLKSYQNIDASMWGGELGSQVSLPWDLFFKGSLSYTRGENSDNDRPLSEIPPLRGTVALRYDNSVYFFEVAENMAMRQDKVDSGLNEQETAGWATTDLKAGVDYKSWSVYGGINNLFDKQYYSHLSYLRDPFAGGVGVRVPENGRNLYITIAYKF